MYRKCSKYQQIHVVVWGGGGGISITLKGYYEILSTNKFGREHREVLG